MKLIQSEDVLDVCYFVIIADHLTIDMSTLSL